MKRSRAFLLLLVAIIVVSSSVGIYLLYFHPYSFSGSVTQTSNIVMTDTDNQALGTLSLALTFSRASSETIDASINASFTGADVRSMTFRTIGSVIILGKDVPEPPTFGPSTTTDYNLTNGGSVIIYNQSYNVSGARDLAPVVMWDIRSITARSDDGKVWTYDTVLHPFLISGVMLWQLGDKTENTYIALNKGP